MCCAGPDIQKSKKLFSKFWQNSEIRIYATFLYTETNNAKISENLVDSHQFIIIWKMFIGDNWTRTSIHSQYAIASFFCLQPQIEKKKEKRSTAFNWICIFVSLFFRIKKSAEIFRSTCMKINQDIGRQFVMEKKFSSRSFVTNL